MTQPDTERHARIAAAARAVHLRLGPNALALAQRGEPIRLSIGEADAIADVVISADQTHAAVLTELEDQRGAKQIAAAAADRFRDVVADCLGHHDDNPGDDTLLTELRARFGRTGPEPTGWRDRLTGYEATRDQINATARSAAGTESGRIVAYRSRGGRLLRCLEHHPGQDSVTTGDFHAVTAEDLEDGGLCTYPVAVGEQCGVDVLITPRRAAAARPDDTSTETGPDEPSTPPCAACTHPMRDHSGRADHRSRYSALVAGDPWCHACNARCDYAGESV